MKNLSLFLFASLILSSCSVKMDMVKRKYNKGWHVQVGSSKTEAIVNNKRSTPKEDSNLLASVDNVLLEETKPLLELEPDKPYKKKEECAEIIMRSGEIIKAKISEVGVSEIKYKKCDNPTGPIYAQKKSDVFMIKYANGTTDVFKEEEVKKEEVEQPAIQRTEVIHTYADRGGRGRMPEGTGIAGMVLGFLGLLFFFFLPITTAGIVANFIAYFLAILFSAIGMGRVSNDPEQFMGKGFGITGFLIGFILLFVLILMLMAGLIVI